MTNFGALGAALEHGLYDPGPIPGGRQLVGYVGGRGELARAFAGMSGPPRKVDYADADTYRADQRRWRTAQRRAQRYADGTRGTKGAPRLSEEQRERIRSRGEDVKLSRGVTRGMRARLYARVRFPSPGKRGGAPDRDRVMPAENTPGVLIDGEQVSEIMRRIEDEGPAVAGAYWLEAFYEAYGLPMDFDIVEVSDLKLWVDGAREPS